MPPFIPYMALISGRAVEKRKDAILSPIQKNSHRTTAMPMPIKMFDGENLSRLHHWGMKIVAQVERESAAMVIISQKLKKGAENGANISVHNTKAHRTENTTGFIADVCWCFVCGVSDFIATIYRGKTLESSRRNKATGVVLTAGRARL